MIYLEDLNLEQMVNTFIISEYLPDTFILLDNKRLGKQRLEAKQIINILEKIDNGEDVSKIGFSSHPATKMWIGYTDALKAYYNLCVLAWIDRGFKNTMELYPINHDDFKNLELDHNGISTTFLNDQEGNFYPPFASFKPFINSHKSALIRKDPEYYKDLRTEEIEPYMNLGYLWPLPSSRDLIYSNWNLNLLEPMGSGVPPQYRISKETAELWVLDKTRNPLTRRSIKAGAKLYKEYETVAKFHKLI